MNIDQRYYMGTNNTNIIFDTKIHKRQWDNIKTKLDTMEVPTIIHQLQYYTLDMCYIYNTDTATTIVVDTPIIKYIPASHCLSVKTHNTTLPFFPTQYEYFNKQKQIVYKYVKGDVVLCETLEHTVTYYEIYGLTIDSIMSIP